MVLCYDMFVPSMYHNYSIRGGRVANYCIRLQCQGWWVCAPTFGGISEIDISNGYSFRHGGTQNGLYRIAGILWPVMSAEITGTKMDRYNEYHFATLWKCLHFESNYQDNVCQLPQQVKTQHKRSWSTTMEELHRYQRKTGSLPCRYAVGAMSPIGCSALRAFVVWCRSLLRYVNELQFQ
jgi:hypothetical protein